MQNKEEKDERQRLELPEEFSGPLIVSKPYGWSNSMSTFQNFVSISHHSLNPRLARGRAKGVHDLQWSWGNLCLKSKDAHLNNN